MNSKFIHLAIVPTEAPIVPAEVYGPRKFIKFNCNISKYFNNFHSNT